MAGWQVTTDPEVLLPGRPVRLTITYTAPKAHESRGAHATIRCVERSRYDRTETTTGADGRMHTRTVTETDEEELHRAEMQLDGGRRFAAGEAMADAPGAWLPSVNLLHGRARGVFHVILARAWAPDIHYVRDVALATTREL